MNDIVFKSKLPEAYLEELEGLLYFNPGQTHFTDGIKASIREFGTPTLSVSDGYINIGMSSGIQPQTLFTFALESESEALVGVLLYTRTSEDTITVLQVAVQEQCQSTFGGELFLRLTSNLRAIARKIRSVSKIVFICGESDKLVIPVEIVKHEH